MEKSLSLGRIYLALIFSAFFWGANFSLGKYVLETVDPLAAATWRFTFAACVMAIVAILKERPNWLEIRKNISALALMALVGVFGFNILFFYGLQITSPVNGSLIMTLNPALTVVLAAVVMKETIQKNQFIGLALSLFGVIIVVADGSWQQLRNLRFATGDVYILLGNLCWAAYGVIGKRAVKNLSSLQITAVTMVIGALVIGGLTLAVTPASMSLPSPMTSAALGVMALLGTVLAYLFWNNAIGAIGPARTSVFFDLVPIFAMLIAISQGHQIVGAQWLGAALVMTGVLFSSGALQIWIAPKRESF